MAITFGGATGWNGASESLRSLRTKEKAADRSPFTPDTPPPVIPFDPRDIERGTDERYGRYLSKLGGTASNLSANFINKSQDFAANLLRSGNKRAFDFFIGNPIGIAKQWANNNPNNYPGGYTYAASKMAGQNPVLAKYLANNYYLDPDSAYMDSANYLSSKSAIAKTTVPLDAVTAAKIGTTAADMYAGAGDVYTGEVDKVTGEALEQPIQAPTEPVEVPKWYEGGDIGVFGGPVQPTEWTDPETGQKYRVEVSQRGFGWYPVGFGQLESPDKPDEDTGGYDWWNYSGFGGGGGGGYYSAPVSYSNSNWIDRILTNWRINRK